MKEKETPQKEAPQTELLIIFTDKDFRFAWTLEWGIEALRAKASAKSDFLKRVWEQTKINAYARLAEKFPKNWKKFSDYENAHKKWFFGKLKEKNQRIKKGEKPMTEKEFFKGMPRFISKIKPKDVKVIFVARDCKTWLQNFEEATYKKFESIIKRYKV